MARWRVRCGDIDLVVSAENGDEAFDSMRDRSIGDFGFLASAEPDENGDPYLILSEFLFERWGRRTDAEVAHAAYVREGFIDA
jgi:hypothetical protein